MAASYFIDRIAQSKFTTVEITFNDSFDSTYKSIKGYLIDDTVSMSSSANWEDLMNMSIQDMMSKAFGEGLGNIAGIITKAFGISSLPAQASIASYMGSEKPEFELGMLFVHTKNNDDKPEKQASYLLSKCYPDFDSEFLLRSPMGYNPTQMLETFGSYSGSYVSGSSKSNTGTCILSIGKWFVMPDLLIRSVNFEYSKECAPDGSPLYAQGTVGFVAARIFSYKEYLNFFINK